MGRAALRLIRADLRARPAQALLTGLGAAIAAGTLVATFFLRGAFDDPWEDLMRATAGPDVVVDGPPGVVARIARGPEVARADVPRPLVDVPARLGGVPARLTADPALRGFTGRRGACVTVRGPPMQRAELHFHLLPDIDDGPVDLDDALDLARAAVADGTSIVTVTPHVRDLLVLGAFGEIDARVRELRAALDAAGIPLRVEPGAELAHDDVPALDDRQLDTIAHGPAGRRWVLIEAPLFGDAEGFLDATAELRARGFGTLIGHPERCAELMLDDGAVARERAAGARLQVNASSLAGAHGEPERAWGLALIRDGLADVIASDAHGASRPPRLTQALAVLARDGLDRGAVEPLVGAAPRALLAQGIAPLRRAA